MSHIIVHDRSGQKVVVEKKGSKQEFLYLENEVKWNEYDDLSRIVHLDLTGGKLLAPLLDSPLAVRYSIQSDVEEPFLSVYVFEVVSDADQPLILKPGLVWKNIDESFLKDMKATYCLPLVEAVRNIPVEVQGALGLEEVTGALPWIARGGFVSGVRKSIRADLERHGYRATGCLRQVQSGPDSMLFRILTEKNEAFYKISGKGSQEAEITRILAGLAPKHVLQPFGVDADRNSFFTDDFGFTVDDVFVNCPEDSLEAITEEAIEKIALFHVEASKFAENLAQNSVLEDTSPLALKEQLSSFILELRERRVFLHRELLVLKSLVPCIESLLDTLINDAIPLTVCHGDLSKANMTQRFEDGESRLFDWYESSVSHPFFDILGSEFGDSGISFVYLDAWRRDEEGYETLQRLATTAGKLVPLWIAFRLIKQRSKCGHNLDWDVDRKQCRFYLNEFIKTLQGM